MVRESAPSAVYGSLFLRLLAALLPVAILAITKYIIDTLSRILPAHQPLPHGFWSIVFLEFALASLGLMVARGIDFLDAIFADRYAAYINTRIMRHAATLDLASWEDPHFYDKLSRARMQGTERIGMIQALGKMVQQLVSVAGLIIGIWFFSPWIVLILLVCLIPGFFGETHFAFLSYSLNYSQTAARREMDYLSVLGASRESIKELKLFDLGPFMVGRYSKLAKEVRRQNTGLARRRLRTGSLLTFLSAAGYYGAYALAIVRTIQGELSLGSLTFLMGAIAGASAGIQALFQTFSSVADQSLFLHDLLEFFSVTPTIVSVPGGLLAPRPVRQGLEFRNVGFTYPGQQRKVLDNISFCVRPSERIALVGENGEGKTTIVKLLTRLYDPDAGQILLDGTDLREYDLEDLWKVIGVIFQDFVKYEMTAADNIAMGLLDARYDPKRIRRAARKSGAEDIIKRLPARYEQILGSRFDDAVDLSGGEWQRVALARAYLRDAELLVLDEPTASLDARSEDEVFQRFAELTEDKMSLLISHRFSTVRMAHRILVIGGGVLQEHGSHEELMRKGGRYAEMFDLQAARYR